MSSLTNHLLHSFYFMSDEDISKSLALEIGSQSSNQIISNPNVESKFQSYTNLNDCENDECLNKAESSPKRKYFTKEEDELLREAALMYGERSWSLIAECVPGKTPKQCRDRWANYLQPSLKFEPWSQEEDELLLSLVSKNGTRWSQLTSHFPNRSTNSVKNRWYWLIKNKGKDKLSKNTAKSRLSNSKRSSKCDCTDSLEKNNEIDFHKIIPNNIQYNPFNYGICSPNFYYDITDNTSEKNNYSLEKKGNPNYFSNTSNNQNIYATDQKINQNVVELKPHINSSFIPSEEDEIITFSPEELNW